MLQHTGGASALIRQISEEASQAVEESLKKQEEKCNEVRSELDSLRRSTSGVEGNEEVSNRLPPHYCCLYVLYTILCYDTFSPGLLPNG